MEKIDLNEFMLQQNCRFTKLLDAVDLKRECLKCTYFNEKAYDSYRCAVLGSCPGLTLSSYAKTILFKDYK